MNENEKTNVRIGGGSTLQKSKGFTLIELLAVIVILAIIALIATPIVLNIISESKESATLQSAEFYLGAVETAVAQKIIDEPTFKPKSCEIQSDGNLKCGEAEVKVEINGETPTSGTITLQNGKINEVELVLSEKTIVKNEAGILVYQIIPTPKSFAEDSWETIAANVKAGNLSAYNVGDTKEIALTEFTNTETDSNGLYTLRIANTSTPKECKTEGFSQTACGFVIEFEDIITFYNMNSAGTNVGGWNASEMRTYVNDTIYKALPPGLQEHIIDTYVVSGHGSTSTETTNFTTTDKLYLLSTKEVWGKEGTSNIITNDTAEVETRQLDYYNKIGVTTSNYLASIKKYNGSNNYCWTRSAFSGSTNYFYRLYNPGHYSVYSYANSSSGVAVAFRIGQ